MKQTIERARTVHRLRQTRKGIRIKDVVNGVELVRAVLGEDSHELWGEAIVVGIAFELGRRQGVHDERERRRRGQAHD
jgi:hypothetical protein